ncbi:hypothetical protein PR202_gb12203 [Eleusine coracana subsp. coracana]|uniref:Uncharacterized protein n=1 Tax=Eleusine coracana subsp. coracana TaxID=191504 RepID=A0AAV5EM75_ELECO|nr:hypothetical protein PR202_gb12203 [Eleusine coracana subsp. coracana]
MAAPTTTTLTRPRSTKTLTIDVLSYSEMKKNLANGNCVEFLNTTGDATVFLRMDNAAAAGAGDDVHVEFKFTLQEVGGGGAPLFMSSTFTRAFCSRKTKTFALRLN